MLAVQLGQLEQQVRLQLVQAWAQLAGEVPGGRQRRLAERAPAIEQRVLDQLVGLDLVAEESCGAFRAEVMVGGLLAHQGKDFALALGRCYGKVVFPLVQCNRAGQVQSVLDVG
ncbi:hypothetical protein D3C72_2159670 [compost metagenome]